MREAQVSMKCYERIAKGVCGIELIRILKRYENMGFKTHEALAMSKRLLQPTWDVFEEDGTAEEKVDRGKLKRQFFNDLAENGTEIERVNNVFFTLLKAGRNLLTFGPALMFDDNITWSELDKTADGMFIELGNWFELTDNQPIRDAWRDVSLTPGGQPGSATIPKIQELVNLVDFSHEQEKIEQIAPAIGSVSEYIVV